ncbi:permease [Campylobacter coli]|uniref:permease n=1 Tax=Campylobacter coli TaxID=195 RepID=UPI00069B6C78|nr:permease [Campylobacter coli]ECL4223696.1 permease [Campylobacter coli]ECL4376649.1 permease [Campylobacter coli]ECL6191433.1 permease [Campylobacter coli]ECL7259541.1 permease [Campylobacter coli]ECO3009371.1 permease [Campylobacter coli]
MQVFFSTFKEFLYLFVELSVLFIGINILVAFLNAKYSNFFEKHLKQDNFQTRLKAIFFGSLTPFCSCSSIPLLNAFLKAKVPLSVCMAYLITSPLINPIIIVVFIVSFGIKISFIYIGFLYAIILFISFLLSKFDTSKFLNNDFLENEFNEKSSCCSTKKCCSSKTHINLKQICIDSLKEYKKILPYALAGTFIGALIHGVFPSNFFEIYLKDYGILGVFIAAFIGVLLYMNCTAMIPVALVLTQTGIPLGIMMSFLIAGAGCSLPELVLLKQMFKMKFLLLFVAIILSVAISFGMLINFI